MCPDDIDAKIKSVLAKVEYNNPIPWFAGIKVKEGHDKGGYQGAGGQGMRLGLRQLRVQAVHGANPNGEEVLQVAAFCKSDALEYLAEQTDGSTCTTALYPAPTLLPLSGCAVMGSNLGRCGEAGRDHQEPLH